MDTHPSEFIILKFQEEMSKLTPELKQFFIKKINDIFKNKMITMKDFKSWFKISFLTMGKLQSTKKRILILFQKEIFQNFYSDQLTKGINLFKNFLTKRFKYC